MADVAKGATPGAFIAHNHKRGNAMAETFA